MDIINTLIKVTQTSETNTIYETFDVSELKESISKLFLNFKNTKLKEILKTEPKIYELYYKPNGEEILEFPLTMIHLSAFRDYEVRYSSDLLRNYPTLKHILDKEISNLQTTILQKWHNGLVHIGFL